VGVELRCLANQPFVCGSTALRLRALRPQLKRDPLGGASLYLQQAPVNRFIRNAAIGAAACSYRALFYRYFDILPVMLGLGALSGCLYTLLEPIVRTRPRLHYLPWVLCAYLVIFGGVGVVGVLKHDQESLEVLTSPGSSASS